MTTEEMQKQIESMMPIPNQIVESIDKNLRNNKTKIDLEKWKVEDFKPFMPCLARQADGELWFPMFFGRYPSDISYAPYAAVSRHCWSQCIPYEGNEHLYMTSDDCEAKYKTWEG